MLKPNDHILFIGDSITHAHRRPEEFHDCYYLGCGYVKMISSVLNTEFPGLNLRITNRGECGHTLVELAQRWDRDCIELHPDVLSILIGINDSHPHRAVDTPDDFCDRYRSLLKTTKRSLPNVQLILIEPFALPIADLNVPVPVISKEHLNRYHERRGVVAKVAAEFGAIFVPTQDAFEAAAKLAPSRHWSLDGIHPSAAGHQLIVRRWLQSIGQPQTATDYGGYVRRPA